MAQISTTIASQYQELRCDLEKKERDAEVKRAAELAKLHELADRLEAAKAAPSVAPPVTNINVPACSASTPNSKQTFASVTSTNNNSVDEPPPLTKRRNKMLAQFNVQNPTAKAAH